MHLRILLAGLLALLSWSAPADEPDSAAPDFSREVRPILSDHCFACHGPDEHDRHADLRLDTADGVSAVIDPGDAAGSELIIRVESDDEDEVMPPPHYNKPLDDKQKDILKRWIATGGEFRGHWAFVKPGKAELSIKGANPIDSFIDARLKINELQRNGRADEPTLLRRVCLDLTGLPPTRDQILRLRRGELDYDTLVDELIASPAFGQHFGRYWLDLVRYADTHGLHLDNYREMWPYRDWVIDAINRNMPFDQFIIEQLAGDLIPDATLAQQIASGFNRLNVTTNEGGSIYEEVFARNVIDRTDAFGTIFLGLTTQCAVCHDHKFDPISQKDYYSLFAFFNSLDGRALDGNKKDPVPVVRVPSESQQGELADFATQLDELRHEMTLPIATVDEAQREWEALLISQDGLDPDKRQAALLPTQATADSGAELDVADDGTVTQQGDVAAKEVHQLTAPVPEGEPVPWQAIRMTAVADPKTNRVGASDNGNVVLSEIALQTRTPEGEWVDLPIVSAIADVEQDQKNFAVKFAHDGQRQGNTGWAVGGHESEGGRSASFATPELAGRLAAGHDQIRIRLHYQSPFAKHQFHAVRFEWLATPPAFSPADRVQVGPLHVAGPFPVESENPGIYRRFASEEGAFKAGEEFTYQAKKIRWTQRDDWKPVEVHSLPVEGDSVAVNVIHQTLTSPKKQSVELLLGTSDSHLVRLNGKRVALSERSGPIRPLHQSYKLELNKGANDLYLKTISMARPAQFAYAYRSGAIDAPGGIVELAREPESQRAPEHAAALRTYYRKVVCTHPDWRALQDLIGGTEAAQEKLRGEIPTTLVWKELSDPRQAKVLVRGQYDQPGEPVDRNVPGFLPPLPEGASRDRLGLAKWLVEAEHPLTGRVAVNRVWQSVFGAGLVKSSEDFGSQGDPPSHPELLDWLAVDFVENGWDLKRLVKQMVTSEAYRRDASVSAEQLAIDPENRFLARGPRHRLDAEVLRDQALALSGLLNQESLGPSVKPPQPSGLWYAVGYTRSNTANFKADSEPEKRLRRSVYIFWKRTSAPPQMSTFDAPSRESCTARRERTNTPLQALLLMNEPQYLKAAKHLAIRGLQECSEDSDVARVEWLFETVTARPAVQAQRNELVSLVKAMRRHYGEHPDQANEILSVDDVSPEGLTAVEQAAWMIVASTMLNLDEVVNK